MPQRRFRITGRVQGVGFRVYVRQTALSLGIRGEVWNRRDGGVEATALHADSAVLDLFDRQLREGPGHVEAVEWESELEEECGPFFIGSSR